MFFFIEQPPVVPIVLPLIQVPSKRNRSSFKKYTIYQSEIQQQNKLLTDSGRRDMFYPRFPS